MMICLVHDFCFLLTINFSTIQSSMCKLLFYRRSGPTWHSSAESYLHGHGVKGSNFTDNVDGGGSSSSSDEGGMVRSKANI